MSGVLLSAEEAQIRAAVGRVVVEQLGVGVTRVALVEGALGRRRFARVELAQSSGGARTLMARVDLPEDPQRRPAGFPAEPPLEPIRAALERAGLPVPRRLGADETVGIELLEDVGDVSLADVAATASRADRDAWYDQAAGLVPRIQRVATAPGVAAFSRRLDETHFAYKAERFARFSLGGDPAGTDVARRAFSRIARVVADAPWRLAHRDLQSANVHVVGGVDPAQGRLVMIDLQGALLAPPEYDLVCLLRDSYVELDDECVRRLCADVRPQLPDAPDAETFAQRFDLLTLSRKGKDHALFLYAARELGDRRYLPYLPPTVRYLRAAAARVAARDPAFRELADRIAELREAPCGP